MCCKECKNERKNVKEYEQECDRSSNYKITWEKRLMNGDCIVFAAEIIIEIFLDAYDMNNVQSFFFC